MAKSKLKDQLVTIKVNQENPEPLELIAKSIIDISNAMEKMNNSSGNEKLLILLIYDQTGIARGTIQRILRVIPDLKKIYLKPIKK